MKQKKINSPSRKSRRAQTIVNKKPVLPCSVKPCSDSRLLFCSCMRCAQARLYAFGMSNILGSM